MSNLSKRRTWGFNKVVLKAVKREAKRSGPPVTGLRFTKEGMNCIESALDSLSFDDILRGCVNDSGLYDVVDCLDMIAREEGLDLRVFGNGKQIYPVI